MSKASSLCAQAVALHEAYNAKSATQKLADKKQHKDDMYLLWDKFNNVKSPPFWLSHNFSKLIEELKTL